MISAGDIISLSENCVLVARNLTDFEQMFAEFRLQHYLQLQATTKNYRMRSYLRKEIFRITKQLKTNLTYGMNPINNNNNLKHTSCQN